MVIILFEKEKMKSILFAYIQKQSTPIKLAFGTKSN